MGSAEHVHPTPPLRKILLATLALAVALFAGSGFWSVNTAFGAVDLRLDFETGNTSQFSSLECPNPSTQLEVYDASRTAYPAPRQGRYAARFSETANDVWSGNNMVRCLAANYDSNESTGDEYYYGFSLYVPAAGLTDNLLWELHHPRELYTLSACSVAPFALHSRSGGLNFRIATGNCNVGAGYAYWQPNIALPGLTSTPRSTWIDFVVHISFSETSGTVEVSYRTGDNPFPATPQLARYAIPTMPYANSANVHNVDLYTEMGLYTGRTGYTSTDTVFLDGYRRGTSKADVMAEFGTQSVPTAVAPTGVAAPQVSGQPTEGQSLSSTAGTWANAPTTFAYQWQSSRDGGATWQNVTGGTGTALTLGPTLVGASLRSVVTASNAAGSATAASAPTSPVAALVLAPSNTAIPVVGGTATSGSALSASSGTWANAPTSFTYQWQSSRDSGTSWQAITGETGQSLALTDALAGATVRVAVTASNAAGAAVALSTAVGPVVAALRAPTNTVPPAISGTPTAGSVLTATTGTWSNTPTGYAHQWQWSNDGGTSWMNVTGATAPTFSVSTTFVNMKVRDVVTATNAAGSTTAPSAAVSTVAAIVSAPANTTAPAIAGTPRAGSALTVGTGTWTGSPTGYAYQWQSTRDNGATWQTVAGATSATLVLSDALVGAGVRAVVTATNSGGSASAASTVVGPVTSTLVAPTVLTSPVITGTAKKGWRLSASTGTWSGSPTAYAYRWEWSRDGGATWQVVSGASRSTFEITSTFVGNKVRVVVTASNAAGSRSAPSAPITPRA